MRFSHWNLSFNFGSWASGPLPQNLSTSEAEAFSGEPGQIAKFIQALATTAYC